MTKLHDPVLPAATAGQTTGAAAAGAPRLVGPEHQMSPQQGGAPLLHPGQGGLKAQLARAAAGKIGGKSGGSKAHHGGLAADAAGSAALEQTTADAANAASSMAGDPGPGGALAESAHGSSHTALWVLGGLAAIGGAAALAGGGKSSAAPTTPAAPATPPPAPAATLVTDSGASATDGITNQGAITVSGLQAGAKWDYSTDSGTTWKAGSGTSFTLGEGSYAAGSVQVRQTDTAGTVSTVGKLAGALTVDTVIADPTIDAVTGDNVLSLAEAQASAGVTVTGTAEANARVTITWQPIKAAAGASQVATAQVTADANGKWSYTFKPGSIPDASIGQTTLLSVSATDLAGNTSQVVTRSVVTDPGLTVSGTITAGQVIDGNDLTVNFYDGRGALLASGVKVGPDGKYSVANLALHKGDVLIAVLANGPAADYTDEATGAARNLGGQLLSAITVGADPAAVLNINPLTTVAARALSLFTDAAGKLVGQATAAQVAAANSALAQALGFSDSAFASLTPEVVPDGGYPAGAALSPAKMAGVLLASLSGLEATGAALDDVIGRLATALVLAEGRIDGAALAELMAGAAQASQRLGTSIADLLSQQLAAAGGANANVSIDSIAGDNVIAAREEAGLTLTGTVAEGATAVALVINNTRLSATIDGTHWSYTLQDGDLAALGQGGAVLQVEATLADGSKASALRAVLIETTLPAQPGVTGVPGKAVLGLADLAADLTITGTGDANAIVRVSLNGGPAREGTVDQSGHWAVTFAKAEVSALQGDLHVSVVAADRFGNVSEAVDVPLAVDRNAPAAPTIDPVGTFGLISPLVIKAGLTVSGTGEAGALVTVGWATDHVQTARVDDKGHWQVTFSSDQLPTTDSVTFTATQTDPAGNTGPAASAAAVGLVRSASALVLGPIAGGDGVNLKDVAHGVTIGGVAAAGSQLTIAWDGAETKTATANANGYWSVTYATLADIPIDGTHTITVSGKDASGLQLTPVSADVVIDTVPPLPPTVDQVTDDGRINKAERAAGVVISGTALDGGAQAWVTWEGKTHKVDLVQDPVTLKWTWSTRFETGEIPIDNAASKLSVKMVDAVGNESAPVEVVVPITTVLPPSPTLQLAQDTGSAANGGSNSDHKSRVGTILVDKLVQGATWEYSVDAGDTWKRGSGNQFTLDPNTYSAGEVLVRQTDVAGNVSQAGAADPLIVKTTAPILTLEDVTDDNTINAAERASGVDVVFSLDNMVDGIPATVTLTWKTRPVNGQPVTIGQPVTLVVSDSASHTVHFAPGDIPDGDLATVLTMTVADAVDNVATPLTREIKIKTSVPPPPTVTLRADTGLSTSDGITNDATMVVDKLTSGPNWEYSTDGGKNWLTGSQKSFLLDDGTYAPGQIQVRQVDSAGNPGTPVSYTAALTVDTSTVEPKIDPIGANGVINAAAHDGGVTITGTAELGAQISVTLNQNTRYAQTFTASDLATLTASKPLGNGLGQWSLTLSGNQLPPDGSNWTITARAVDVAGNASSPDGVTVPFTVDTRLPASPTINALAHDNAITAVERQQGVTFTGTTEAGTTVAVLFNGISRAATVTGTQWSASFAPGEIPADTAAGATASLTVTATTASANTSDAASVALVVDTTTPVPTITPLPGDLIGSPARGDGLTLNGQAEANAVVTVTLAGQTVSATADGSGHWQATLAGWQLPADGAQTITAIATDRYGNTSSQQSYAVTLDTRAPSQLSLKSVGNADYLRVGSPAQVTGKATPGALVWVTWAGGTPFAVTADATSGDWRADLPLDPGQTGDRTVELKVAVADAAGNVGPAMIREVPVLGTAHQGPVIAPVTGDDLISAAELLKGFRINGYAAPGAQVEVDALGQHRTLTADSTTGLWTMSVAGGQALADGHATITLTQNGQTVTRDLVIDTQAPGAPTISDVTGANAGAHTADLRVTLAEKATGQIVVTGQTEHDSTVQVTWGTAERYVVADGNGVWTATFKAGELPASGTSKIVAMATDLAGNQGPAGETTVTVDTSLIGTPGNDRLVGSGQGDEISGNAGDDTIVIPDLTFRKIDGGVGVDTVVLGQSVRGATLDLTHLGGGQSLTNIEGINLTGGGANHLVVDQASILADTGNKALWVTGSAGEAVTAFGFAKTAQTSVADGATYTLYTSGQANLWVDNRIDHVVL